MVASKSRLFSFGPLLSLLSFVFLYFIAGVSFNQLLFLFFISSVFFLLLKKINSSASLVLAGVSAIFFASKVPVLFHGRFERFHLLPFVGLSFVVLKVYHFAVDQKKGLIKTADVSFLEFLNYIIFFPTFISGPIVRFQDFSRDLTLPKFVLPENTVELLERIFRGILKKFVLVSFLEPLTLHSYDIPGISFCSYMAKMIAYSFLIYFDFSGYSDIAIGVAKFLGFSVPENFNSPYFKKNLIEFWNNWHMSFSSWLRNYIFMPTGHRLFKTPLKKKPVLIAFVSYVFTFLLCGFWHGSGANFILWGLYHGIGLFFTKVMVDRWKRKSIEQNKGAASRWKGVLSTILLFIFVTIGWTFFVLDIADLYLLKEQLLRSVS